MRLTLVLLRHGEAEDQAPGPPGPRGRDHGRRLTRRGRTEALAAVARCGATAPALVLASDAVRTRETAEILAGALSVRLELHPELYLGATGAHAKVVAGVGPDVSVLVLVGHNPVLSTWASRLSGDFVSLDTGDSVTLSIEARDFAEAVALAGGWQAVS